MGARNSTFFGALDTIHQYAARDAQWGCGGFSHGDRHYNVSTALLRRSCVAGLGLLGSVERLWRVLRLPDGRGMRYKCVRAILQPVLPFFDSDRESIARSLTRSVPAGAAHPRRGPGVER